jgi:hypothetical protein
MCFSESQSFFNFILLIIGSLYTKNNYRLSLPLLFLSLKDLIQGFLYRYKNDKKINNILTTLSYVHIGFQPLFVNLFISNFSKQYDKIWNVILPICFVYGLYYMTSLEELDIQNDPNCKGGGDYCADETLSYMGQHHIAYRFERDVNTKIIDILYIILTFIPGVLLAGNVGLLWTLFVALIYTAWGHVDGGEKSAIWCFLSILFALPLAIFEKQVFKLL